MGFRPYRVLALLITATGADAFTTFETGQVRPLALSPDGTRLFATNTRWPRAPTAAPSTPPSPRPARLAQRRLPPGCGGM